jgi:hypothetical protein
MGADVPAVRTRDDQEATPPLRVVKTYGRGSFLGLLSPLLALLMARQGMNGWRQSAAREMEDDAAVMARKGYRVASSDEIGVPLLGIVAFRVTYERTPEPG